ncbi:hypothetical protein CEK25_004164 [Fusarium fujikuroi]|nr:hypothetical protein CEK25_004164 [Fusarium fujikuroi]
MVARLVIKYRRHHSQGTCLRDVMSFQAPERTDGALGLARVAWLRELHEFPKKRRTLWDWQESGRGVAEEEVADGGRARRVVPEEGLLRAQVLGELYREQRSTSLKLWVKDSDEVMHKRH